MDCVSPTKAGRTDSLISTTMGFLTMLTNRTSNISKITEHLRDVIYNWKHKHAENSHAEEKEQSRRKTGTTNGGQHGQHIPEMLLHEKHLSGEKRGSHENNTPLVDEESQQKKRRPL